MPDKSATTPDGRTIDFNDAAHLYTCRETGQHFTSGTTIVKKLAPKFDADGSIAARCALRDGLTVEQVKANWAATGAEACRRGTRMHEVCEYGFTGDQSLNHVPEDDQERLAFAAGLEMVDHLKSTYRFLSAEQILASHKMGIAGMVDILMADVVNKMLLILDWKSNKAINRFSPFGNKMLGMLSHLDECELNTYTLQLGLYERIIRGEGYLEANGFSGWKVKRVILHIPPMQPKCFWIECPDMRAEVGEMIIHHLTDVPF